MRSTPIWPPQSPDSVQTAIKFVVMIFNGGVLPRNAELGIELMAVCTEPRPRMGCQ